MTRGLDVSTTTALAADALVPRDFIWITARDRDTDAPFGWGAWSDLGTVIVQVNDFFTQQVETRTFEGAGNLVEVSDIRLVTGLVVQNATVKLNQISPSVANVIRGFTVRRAPIQIFRGLMDPQTRQMVAPAVPRFAGFIDAAPIVTPPAGNAGSVTLRCVSHVQETTRQSTATRSDSDQRLRNPIDTFYQDTAVVPTWDVGNWGAE